MIHFLLFPLQRLRLSCDLVGYFIWPRAKLERTDIDDLYFRKYSSFGIILGGLLHQCFGTSIGILSQNYFYYCYRFLLMRLIWVPLIISYLLINDNYYFYYSFWNDFRIILDQNYYYLRYNDIYMEFVLFPMNGNFVYFLIIWYQRFKLRCQNLYCSYF